jgi:hypothetical protein
MVAFETPVAMLSYKSRYNYPSVYVQYGRSSQHQQNFYGRQCQTDIRGSAPYEMFVWQGPIQTARTLPKIVTHKKSRRSMLGGLLAAMQGRRSTGTSRTRGSDHSALGIIYSKGCDFLGCPKICPP